MCAHCLLPVCGMLSAHACLCMLLGGGDWGRVAHLPLFQNGSSGAIPVEASVQNISTVHHLYNTLVNGKAFKVSKDSQNNCIQAKIVTQKRKRRASVLC